MKIRDSLADCKENADDIMNAVEKTLGTSGGRYFLEIADAIDSRILELDANEGTLSGRLFRWALRCEADYYDEPTSDTIKVFLDEITQLRLIAQAVEFVEGELHVVQYQNGHLLRRVEALEAASRGGSL